jgi:glycosyltransferase involved in cell wall biosynthesis
MELAADQITIAITVYNRRQYLRQAISSALGQTAPVRVIVVEDCGPDETLQSFVQGEFGDRIEYYRNPIRRGLFGNWNACLEYCRTPWLSILHDDDYLAPGFVEAMLALHREARDCALYFGHFQVVNDVAQAVPEWQPAQIAGPWQRVHLSDVLFLTPFSFAGQLFRVESARGVGGFRATSQYCGDWELWAKLIAHNGAARTRALVAVTRSHTGPDRETNRIHKAGKVFGLTFVQRKRVLGLSRQLGTPLPFDRRLDQKKFPLPITLLVEHGLGMTRRLLRYNVGLMLISQPPHWRYAVFQSLTRVFGVPFVLAVSRTWNFVCRRRRRAPGA